jgi:hypothetical protein
MRVKRSTVLILLALALGLVWAAKDGGGEDGGATDAAKAEMPSRAALGVVMHEKNTASGSALVVTARRATETRDGRVVLEDFRLEQTGDLELTGGVARYDTRRSLLEIDGPAQVHTTEGWRADLNGLSWDRTTGRAVTVKPLRATGAQGTIHADGGEFLDDFSRIMLSGDVHANIAPDLLRH